MKNHDINSTAAFIGRKKRNHESAWSLMVLIVIFFLSPGYGFSAVPGAGKLIDLSGQVDVNSSNRQEWEKAVKGRVLLPGDALRTGAGSRAAILLVDETLLQLNQNSLIVLKQVGERAGWLNFPDVIPVSGSAAGSSYLLKRGGLWMRNKNRNQQIEILTPHVSTSIRGTELDIRIALDDTVIVTVLEGTVQTSNTFGSLIVGAMEQATAMPGKPLKKQLLISPRDSVQWTIPMVSFADHLFVSLPEGDSLALVKDAYSLIKRREFDAAETDLGKAVESMPDPAPAWMLRSLVSLARGKTEDALEFAEKGIELAPDNPDAWIVKSYGQQAKFDLVSAMEDILTALSLDPSNVPALVNFAKLAFSSGNTDKALDASKRALAIDGESAEAHNLHGFLMLAKRRTGQAISSFSRAVDLDSGFGEPHLGLALAYMRQGLKAQAIEEITTAVLLEPQRSLFLSYWAKMLYELKRFKQALDILAQAEQLDPNDPTPLLYKSHILRDLNQPTEAIHALNKAIALNDNRAVYRSRFFLDQDLAVKNVTLAELYSKLGLSEWGGSKAIASVKYDYNNSAAHDFLAEEYRYLAGGSSIPARSERLKAFLLKPANLNTFNSFNDYTAFFEQPDISGTLTGFIGNMGYWDAEADLHGAVPTYDTAFRVVARRSARDGFKGSDYEDYDDIRAEVKWDITDKDTLSVQTNYESLDQGDIASRLYDDMESDPQNQAGATVADIKVGYCRHFSPDSDFLVYVNRNFYNDSYADAHFNGEGTTVLPDVLPGVLLDYYYDYVQHTTLEEPFTTFQTQQFYRTGDHQFNLGVFQYWSERDYASTTDTAYDFFSSSTGDYLFSYTDSELAASNRPRRQQSYYLQDIWNVNKQLTIEAALYIDSIDNVNSDYNTQWSDTSVDPRLGLIFRPSAQDTLSASIIRYLDPVYAADRLDPIDIAGHTLPTFYEGSIIDEVSLSWEHEWKTGYWIGRWFYNEPEYHYTVVEDDEEQVQTICNTYRGVEIGLNQMIGQGIGFSSGYTFFDIVEDQYTPELEGNNHWLWGLITLVHPSGVSIGFGPNYFNTRYDDPSMEDGDFWVFVARLEYELPNKRGNVRIEGLNLFNKHFDDVLLSNRAGWLPERFYALRVKLNF